MTKWRVLTAGVRHFICLITNHLDGENVKTRVISPAQDIFLGNGSCSADTGHVRSRQFENCK